MFNVTILAFDGSPLSSIALHADILNAAGVLWNSMKEKPQTPFFNVTLTTPDGCPVDCYRTIPITPHCSFADIPETDIVVVGALVDTGKLKTRYPQTLSRIRTLQRGGTTISSICSGAFILAEAGLLDNKRATTHWGLSQLFKRLYPKVIVSSDQIVVDEGNILTSGGTTAGGDLALHLIRRFCGDAVADETARVLLLDPYRTKQSPYEVFQFSQDHDDTEILETQEWIDTHFNKNISVDSLAELCTLGRRTFERRFKKATGDSPLKYLQRVRIEKAKSLLLSTDLSFDSITLTVGYEDQSTFRRLFINSTGLSPGLYRRKFQHPF